MQRKASAIWHGGLRDGTGTISTASQVLSNASYTFGARFESSAGTNPEELVAAAHAACFSMALSSELEKQGAKPNRVSTEATATLEKRNEGWCVTGMHLESVAEIPNASEELFQSAAAKAKDNCPISRLLNAPITLNARLEKKAA